MKQHKGNIILMVLFILISASAFALLMMQYTESMFDHTRMTYDYNKAYYLANAGVELGLADSLGNVGYEKEFTDPEHIFCEEGTSCGMTGSIDARSTFHANVSEDLDNARTCTTQNAFTLTKGDSLAFPLFRKDSKQLGPTQINITDTNNQALALYAGGTIKNENSYISKLMVDGDDKPLPQSKFHLSQIDQGLNGEEGEYLILINKGSDTSFCVSSSNPIPRQRLRVDGEGTFNDYSISLSAAKKVTLPGFLFSTSVGRE